MVPRNNCCSIFFQFLSLSTLHRRDFNLSNSTEIEIKKQGSNKLKRERKGVITSHSSWILQWARMRSTWMNNCLPLTNTTDGGNVGLYTRYIYIYLTFEFSDNNRLFEQQESRIEFQGINIGSIARKKNEEINMQAWQSIFDYFFSYPCK